MGSRLVRVQTLEEVLDLTCRAIAGKWLLATGWQLSRVLAPALPSYPGAKQRWATSIALLSVWWGESKRTGAAGLVSELALPRVGETLELQEGPWHTGATHSHQRTCIEHVYRARRTGRERSSGARTAKRAVRQLLQQIACDLDTQGGDRVGIMPFWANAVPLADASPRLRIQHGRGGLRGKNGSAR